MLVRFGIGIVQRPDGAWLEFFILRLLPLVDDVWDEVATEGIAPEAFHDEVVHLLFGYLCLFPEVDLLETTIEFVDGHLHFLHHLLFELFVAHAGMFVVIHEFTDEDEVPTDGTFVPTGIPQRQGFVDAAADTSDHAEVFAVTHPAQDEFAEEPGVTPCAFATAQGEALLRYLESQLVENFQGKSDHILVRDRLPCLGSFRGLYRFDFFHRCSVAVVEYEAHEVVSFPCVRM